MDNLAHLICETIPEGTYEPAAESVISGIAIISITVFILNDRSSLK